MGKQHLHNILKRQRTQTFVHVEMRATRRPACHLHTKRDCDDTVFPLHIRFVLGARRRMPHFLAGAPPREERKKRPLHELCRYIFVSVPCMRARPTTKGPHA